LAACTSTQKRIVFPGSVLQGTPRARLIVHGSQRLVHLSLPDGTPIVAVFAPASYNDHKPLPDTAGRPTVLFFYGNLVCAADVTSVSDHFRCIGCNTMVVDYAGYGMSCGKPSETNCYATADAALDWLLKQPNVDDKQIIYAGWSLGGAVAIDLAKRRPPLKLITFSTFTTLAAMAHKIFWLPVPCVVLAYRFDSISKIGEITCPMLLIHGTCDQVIPSKMTDELAAAAEPGKAEVVKIPGDHYLVLYDKGVMWDEVSRFIHTSNR
jgi:pimeloyl-ACP methyl ester carboxylesterase